MEFTLANVIREQAACRPAEPCLTFEDRTLTFGDLDRRSSQAANALIGAGVVPGDRIAVLARNSSIFYELAFAAGKVAAVMTGLNWRLASPEIAAIVRDLAPRVIVAGREQRGLLPPPDQLDAGVTVIGVEEDYPEWIGGGAERDPAVPSGPDDVVLQLYTSGTTGEPKGAMLTNANMSFTPRTASELWSFTAASVHLVSSPLFHIGGIGTGMAGLMHGGHTVLLQQPDPDAIINAIEKYHATHAFFVPTLIQSILSAPAVAHADLSSLELIIYGASPISESVLLRAMDVLGCRFTHAYGMTETAGTVVSLPPDDHDPSGPRADLLRSCGRSVPWAEVRIVDPASGDDVRARDVGEVWVRSPQNMKGYWRKPEETARTLTGDGWLRTGDAAYRDEAGYIYLHDRYKDMIVSGGENIYPVEIENVLAGHPEVAGVAVIGVPDERWGETVKAIVVRTPGANVSGEELVAYSRERLAGYKCPRSVDFADALPQTPSGKVLKHELRKPYWQGRERLIH